MTVLDRRALLAGIAASAATPALATIRPRRRALNGPNIEWLESLRGQVDGPYLAPSEIDAAYTHAIYVNVGWAGPGAQKMWIVERDAQSAMGWRLAHWDTRHWDRKGGIPAYSWPVSTGKVWPGQKRAGPTPTGIFNVDDRSSRHCRGWCAEGMYNSIFIDLHYSSGRASGVAMHGTNGSQYRKLGRPASHGCVRMRQDNADTLWRMFHPTGRSRDPSPLWSEAVPRYFRSEPSAKLTTRRGYVRDGSLLTGEAGEVLTKAGYSVLLIYFRHNG